MAKRILIEVLAVLVVLMGVIYVYDTIVAPTGDGTEYCILPKDSNLADIKGLSPGDIIEVDVHETVCPPCGVRVEVSPQLVGKSKVAASRVLPCAAGTGSS